MKTFYDKVRTAFLYAPMLAVWWIEMDDVARLGVLFGWLGLVMILMDIRGLLLYPKESRMELDPDYKKRVEAGREA